MPDLYSTEVTILVGGEEFKGRVQSISFDGYSASATFEVVFSDKEATGVINKMHDSYEPPKSPEPHELTFEVHNPFLGWQEIMGPKDDGSGLMFHTYAQQDANETEDLYKKQLEAFQLGMGVPYQAAAEILKETAEKWDSAWAPVMESPEPFSVQPVQAPHYKYLDEVKEVIPGLGETYVKGTCPIAEEKGLSECCKEGEGVDDYDPDVLDSYAALAIHLNDGHSLPRMDIVGILEQQGADLTVVLPQDDKKEGVA